MCLSTGGGGSIDPRSGGGSPYPKVERGREGVPSPKVRGTPTKPGTQQGTRQGTLQGTPHWTWDWAEGTPLPPQTGSEPGSEPEVALEVNLEVNPEVNPEPGAWAVRLLWSRSRTVLSLDIFSCILSFN